MTSHTRVVPVVDVSDVDRHRHAYVVADNFRQTIDLWTTTNRNLVVHVHVMHNDGLLQGLSEIRDTTPEYPDVLLPLLSARCRVMTQARRR